MTLNTSTASSGLTAVAEKRKETVFNAIFLAGFFLFTWLAVFAAAIMNGDDVVHFAASFRSALLPELHQSWTPNRVIDIYGRSLLSAVFSFLFFSINSFTQISFFTLYKLLSAILFAAFATYCLAYILRCLGAATHSAVYRLALSLLMAAAVFLLFYWRNQVHFICYQLPAFLCFVLLKKTFDSRERTVATPEFSSLVLLSYLCAFSLESFALIVFLFNLLLLAYVFKSEARWQFGRMWHYVQHASYPKLLLINLFLSAMAICVTVFFSDRSQGAPHSDYLGAVGFFVHSPAMPLGIVLLAMGAWLWFRRSSSLSDAAGFCFTVYLGLIALGTTLVVSAKANTNYFSLADYPWGDMLLIGKLAMLYLVGLGLSRLASYRTYAQVWLPLLLLIGFSKLIYVALEKTEADSIRSVQAAKIYDAVSASGKGPIVTGFNLDAIPMQIRPFPTATSPEWFIKAYQATFIKFYGVAAVPEFR